MEMSTKHQNYSSWTRQPFIYFFLITCNNNHYTVNFQHKKPILKYVQKELYIVISILVLTPSEIRILSN